MFNPNVSQFTPEQLEIFKRFALPTPFDTDRVARKHLDLQYGTLPEQTLDLFLPDTPSDTPLPLLIYIHGGGWTLGTKREGALDGIIGLLRRGWAIISVDYRLAPATKFPEFLFDVKTAVRWARANAETYGLDPQRFVAMGDSAGAHLALMLGFTEGHPEYEGEKYGHAGFSSAVQAVVNLYAPTILGADNTELLKESGVPMVSLSGGGNDRAALDKMLTAISTDPDMLPLVSPVAYVHPGIPPVLIMHGKRDPIVPVQHGTALYERICAVCGSERVDMILYPERVHADREFMCDETADTIYDFVLRRGI